MSYQEFIEYVKEHILDYVQHDEAIEVEVHQVVKNNGVVLDGICIRDPKQLMVPNIYLNGFYEEYQEGEDLDSILMSIVAIHQGADREFDIDPDDLYHYDKTKENVIIRLVGYESNKERLKDCPYIQIHDFAVTFRWLVDMDQSGVATIMITNKELNRWGIAVEELYEVALRNTMRLFPAVIRPLGSMLVGYLQEAVECFDMKPQDISSVREDIAEYIAGEKYQPPLYVLSNEKGVNGAVCILYQDVLKKFADTVEKDLYILPSSVHEVILVPDTEELSLEELRIIVKEANQTVVSPFDILTDSVYHYSRMEDCITIA